MYFLKINIKFAFFHAFLTPKEVYAVNDAKKSALRTENMTMRALYLIAIVAVVDGHTMLGNMFDMDRLFRYYSYHMMLFAFGSGYFFSAKGSLLSEIGHRAKKMLIPLYFWNVVYGLIAAFLRHAGEFEFGEPISAYTLLLAPIVDGEHFSWNLASWFVFPLFLTQVVYLLVRRVSKLWKDNEWLTFALCLAVGVTAVQLCYTGHNDALPLFMMRMMILLPGYAGGVLYRRRLEKHDNLPTVPYLLGIVLVRVLLTGMYPNMAYLVSNCEYFGCDAFGVYFGGALSIAFFLRLARLLAPYMEKSKLLLTISRHTFDIMMHHYMAFFFVNCVFLVMNMLSVGAPDFSVRLFRTERTYCYAPDSKSEWDALYLAAGLLLPLIVVSVQEKLKKIIFKSIDTLK